MYTCLCNLSNPPLACPLFPCNKKPPKWGKWLVHISYTVLLSSHTSFACTPEAAIADKKSFYELDFIKFGGIYFSFLLWGTDILSPTFKKFFYWFLFSYVPEFSKVREQKYNNKNITFFAAMALLNASRLASRRALNPSAVSTAMAYSTSRQ